MGEVLDLFAGLGGFSQAFEASDRWNVTTVDIEERFETDIQADVLDLRPGDLPDADVILASPPCTFFSTAGNHDSWDGERPTSAGARESIALVYHTLGLIHAINPDYWLLENPRGRLRWFLGKPTGTVTYCQYGTEYMKPTDLWGRHPPGLSYKSCSAGADCHVSNTENDGTEAIQSMPPGVDERAKVPAELSQSIREAIESAYDSPEPKQVRLEEVLAHAQ